MTYRNDLDALTARQAVLEAEVRDRTRELDQARRLVEEIHARARLPVLDNLRVAAPCSASWDAMAGDARVRACGDCQKNVYNLSEMTRDEAEGLIREKEGRLCVRYFQRADGTILLKDCAVGVKRRRRRRFVAAGVAASLASAAFGISRERATLGGLESERDVLMGEMQTTVGVVALPTEQLESPPEEAPPAEAPHEQPPRVRMGKMVLPTEPREIKGELSVEPPRRPLAPPARRAPHK